MSANTYFSGDEVPKFNFDNKIGGIYIFECNLICETGQYHKERNMPNEDHASSAQNGQLAVMAISDGAGAMGNGGVAAAVVSNALCKELFEKFQEYYFSDGNTAKRKLALLTNQLLTEYSQSNNIDPSSLACTIMLAAVDDTGRCICFHLGDGIILRRKKNHESWDVVSSPRNGIQSNTTYLTMNCEMWNNLQFYRWKDPEHESLLLLTDGASNHLIYRTGSIGWQFTSSCEVNMQSIKQYIDAKNPDDDYTCGLITLK